MTAAEIGEYTGCTHGDDGKPLFGCIECAIVWHTQQARNANDEHTQHMRILARLRAQAADGSSQAQPSEAK